MHECVPQRHAVILIFAPDLQYRVVNNGLFQQYMQHGGCVPSTHNRHFMLRECFMLRVESEMPARRSLPASLCTPGRVVPHTVGCKFHDGHTSQPLPSVWIVYASQGCHASRAAGLCHYAVPQGATGPNRKPRTPWPGERVHLETKRTNPELRTA